MLWLSLVAYLTSVPAVTDAPQHGFLTGNGHLPHALPLCGDMTSSMLAASPYDGASVSTNTSMLLDSTVSPPCGATEGVSTTTKALAFCARFWLCLGRVQDVSRTSGLVLSE